VRKGFTLIELSIVLVIIGLIVGGMLVGRQLLQLATTRKTISQLQDMDATLNAFRTKYNCLPGDCIRATQYFPTSVNGDGNGTVDGYPESPNLFNHLLQAGMITGTYESYADAAAYEAVLLDGFGDLISSPPLAPRLANGLQLNIAYGTTPAAGHFLYMAEFPIQAMSDGGPLLSVFQTYYNDCGADRTGKPCWMSPQEAYAIDTKIDNGMPLSGKMQTVHAQPDCVSDDKYVATTQSNNCIALISSSGLP